MLVMLANYVALAVWCVANANNAGNAGLFRSDANLRPTAIAMMVMLVMLVMLVGSSGARRDAESLCNEQPPLIVAGNHPWRAMIFTS